MIYQFQRVEFERTGPDWVRWEVQGMVPLLGWFMYGVLGSEVAKVSVSANGLQLFEVDTGFDIEAGTLVPAGVYLQHLSELMGVKPTSHGVPLWMTNDVSPIGPCGQNGVIWKERLSVAVKLTDSRAADALHVIQCMPRCRSTK